MGGGGALSQERKSKNRNEKFYIFSADFVNYVGQIAAQVGPPRCRRRRARRAVRHPAPLPRARTRWPCREFSAPAKRSERNREDVVLAERNSKWPISWLFGAEE